MDASESCEVCVTANLGCHVMSKAFMWEALPPGPHRILTIPASTGRVSVTDSLADTTSNNNDNHHGSDRNATATSSYFAIDNNEWSATYRDIITNSFQRNAFKYYHSSPDVVNVKVTPSKNARSVRNWKRKGLISVKPAVIVQRESTTGKWKIDLKTGSESWKTDLKTGSESLKTNLKTGSETLNRSRSLFTCHRLWEGFVLVCDKKSRDRQIDYHA